jgi:diacylglycerol kinase (ATP)
VTAAIVMHVSVADWRWLILSITIVLAAEAGNSAIEQLCDLLHPGQHPAIKRVKDLAAGGVLLCAVAAALIGAATFLPYVVTHAVHLMSH